MSATRTLAQTFPAGGSLEVYNPRGDVTISGTSDDNQIHIILHKEIYTRTDSDAGAKAQQLSPKITSDGNTLRFALPAIEGAHADIIITLPAASSTTVTSNQGDIHFSGLKGAVKATANHGNLEISDITGPVTAYIQNSDSNFSASTVNGPVTLEGKGGDITISDVTGLVGIQGDFFGNIHLERVRSGFKFHSSRTDFQIARLDGDADFTEHDLSADQAVGPIILSTRNRNVTFDRVTGDVNITNKNGKVDITSAPPVGNITVENRNGEVNLTLPDQAAFHVDAETSDADIENDFALPITGNGSKKWITGTVGKGTSTIKITTTQEDVSLKRATVTPLAPLAPIAPLPPIPPTAGIPPEAQKAIKEAQKEAQKAAQEGQREAQKAAKEAQKAAKDASQQP